MKNIGIMVCNKVSYICTGSGCFNAFNNKKKAFEIYKEEEVSLGGFFHCNGCGKEYEEELVDKLKVLKKKDVEVIHMALCIDVECSNSERLEKIITDNGFLIVRGTH
ncbi:MAG: CGGC domain-containing protein [Clostridium sp.]|uniref:CGGC domain-containing protein n=1 Tax=Clostridium sp. TaxID=1506 RepID=UPI003033E1A0